MFAKALNWQDATLLAALLTVSCLTQAAGAPAKLVTDAEQFASDKPAELQPIFKALYIEGEHNAVLNLDYLGLAAMETREYTTAEKAFDAAIARIDAIYANNPAAEKAKSVFASEKVKDFKGEPYERAMTYFYRGVLYLRVGDYQNARASFLSAERQSTLSEKESYDSTFGMMDYLAGWASHCDGDDARASELRDRAAKTQPQIFAELQPTVSYIALIDVGSGPSKVGVGQYKEKLAFKPGDGTQSVSSITAQNATAGTPVMAADINWQATTRGGRPVDAILNGKAQWKSGTDTAGTVLTGVGFATTLQGIQSNNQNMANAGEIGMVVGMFSSLLSKTMTAEADTRTWANLPAAVALTAGQLQPTGAPGMSFVIAPSGGSGTAAVSARNGTCGFSWGRSDGSLHAAIEHVSNPIAAEAKHEEVNAQFRTLLASTFESAPTSPPAAANK